MKLYFSIAAFVLSIIAIYNIPYALSMEDVPCNEKDARMFQQIAALDSRDEEDKSEKGAGISDDRLDFKKFGRESRKVLEETEKELKLLKTQTRQQKERDRKKRQKERKKLEAAAIAATAPLRREAAMHAVAKKATDEAEARNIKATQASMKRVDEKLFPTAVAEPDNVRGVELALERKLKAMGASRQRKIVTAATAASEVQYFDIPRSTFASMESAAPIALMIKTLTDQGYTVSMENNPDGTTARLAITGLSEKEHRALMVSNIFGTKSGKEVAALSRGFDCTDHLDGPVTIVGAGTSDSPASKTSKERALVVFKD